VTVAAGRWRRLQVDSRLHSPSQASVAEWLASFAADSEVSRAVRAVLDAPTHEHGVAEINDLLRDVEHDLERDRAVARSMARVVLFVGWLAAAIELLASQSGRGALLALVAVAAGGVGAAACWELGRRAELRSSELRGHWNRVARWLERRIPSACRPAHDQSVDPAREQR
jgi:hypothetical protein